LVFLSVPRGSFFSVLASGENAVAQIPRSQAVFQPGDAVQLAWDAADGMAFS
jgi:TOBE domain